MKLQRCNARVIPCKLPSLTEVTDLDLVSFTDMHIHFQGRLKNPCIDTDRQTDSHRRIATDG